MEEQELENRPELPKHVEEAIEDIQVVARATGNKDLTFNQAYSIYLRSKQLAKEAEEFYDVEKARQINWCWKQRRGN